MNLRRKKTREFWRIFKTRSVNQTSQNISIDESKTHFENVAFSTDINVDQECNEFLNNFQQSELDRPFSRDEICAAIKKLGNNKACSTDNILYEYRYAVIL